MKILIFGAGGVGSVVGGLLARTGHEVSLLGRARHLDVIRKEGLTLTGLWGDYRIKAFDLYTQAKDTYGKAFDLIFLTVKSYDTKDAVEELVSLMRPETTLISLQNGLGNIETILTKVKPEQFLIGRIITGVELGPGRVKVTVSADDILIGPVPGSEPHMGAEKAAILLRSAHIPARSVTDILPHIWSKVIYNCALNGICTLLEIPYGRILEKEETRRQMADIVRECYVVARRKNIRLEPSSAEAYLELLAGKLIPLTADHYPSMLQDLKKGKRLDIEALNGAICRLGLEVSVPTPANQWILSEVQKKHTKDAHTKVEHV